MSLRVDQYCLLLVLLRVTACGTTSAPQPSPTLALTDTPVPTHTASPTFTVTLIPTATSTPTPTCTLTVSPTLTPLVDPCSRKPQLLAPANGNIVNTLRPVCRWESAGIPNESIWEIEVATDPEFTNIDRYHSMRLSQEHYKGNGERLQFELANLNPGTIYYWRVRLSCDELVSDYSDAWSFTTSTGMIPAAPRLLSPANGTTLLLLPVTFQWEPVAGAKEYLVGFVLSGVGGFGFPVSDTKFILTWSPLPEMSLSPGTTYSWAVTAVSDYAIGEPSEWWQFQTPQAP